MDRTNIEMKMTELFMKARELADQCGAEVCVMIISSDEKKIYKFVSSDLKKILAKCLKSDEIPAFHELKLELYPASHELRPEIYMQQMEIDVLRGGRKRRQKQLYVLGNINSMDFDELDALERQLQLEMMSIKDRKTDILKDQLMQSRMHVHQTLQQNQILMRQVAELQSFLQSTRTEHNVSPADRRSLPSTSSAEPYAIDKDPETSPYTRVFFPLTSSAAQIATDNSQSDRNSPAKDSDSSLSFSFWQQNEDTGRGTR